MRPLQSDPDRFFSPDPTVREIARRLFGSVAGLPLVCPHGHVPPQILSGNEPFPEPTSLIIKPDHYITRMLVSQGIRMEELGLEPAGGGSFETNPRAVWQTFAENYHLFLGTPTRAWLDYEFYHVFGVQTKLDGDSAMDVYEHIYECLGRPEFRPRALFEKFNIEVLTTTDAATDPLEHHREISNSGWAGKVLPCFRPDALFRIATPGWKAELDGLKAVTGIDVSSYRGFISALEDRRSYFRNHGATSTDHGVLVPFTERLSEAAVDALFQKALAGAVDGEDQARFEGHMLMEMARMSCEDGLVMQIHPGSLRDYDPILARQYGPDSGADIPIQTEYTRNLRSLLNEYGAQPRFRLVVFTLDESTYSRELAPLAGYYPAMRLGPPWWFFDSFEGMMRYRKRITETAGFFNTAGFNDDTRAFPSIPARHDIARRADANYVASLVARHEIEEEDALTVMKALAYDLVRETYRLEEEGVSAESTPKQ